MGKCFRLKGVVAAAITLTGTPLFSQASKLPAEPDDGLAIVQNAATWSMAMPSVSGRTAYISQIGDANSGTISQTASEAYARIDQNGDRNRASIQQSGSGTAYADIHQGGSDSIARASQGAPGQNLLALVQNGAFNTAVADQHGDGAGVNAARMTQSGTGQTMQLTQNGGGNVADLQQEGVGNSLTAVQSNGSQLSFLQQGTGLNFYVAQGRGSLAITQVNPK